MTASEVSKYVYTPEEGMPSYFTIDIRSVDDAYTTNKNRLKVDVNWHHEVDENLELVNSGKANAKEKAFMMMLKRLWNSFCKREEKLARKYVVTNALEQIKERNIDFYNFLMADA